jgi:putative DNA methylase
MTTIWMWRMLDDVARAAFVYLAISIDKSLNWNARQATWNVNLEGMRSVFDTHNFSMKWTFGEMVPLADGSGYDWVVEQVCKGISELVSLSRPDTLEEGRLIRNHPAIEPAPVTITCKSADALNHIGDDSIDVVVMDPPYYDNVMYAELSDFFYVWLKSRPASTLAPF